MKIGEEVKRLRKKTNLTQVEFAERVGLGLNLIRRLEQNKTNIRMDKTNQVLEFLGYHLEVIKNEKKRI